VSAYESWLETIARDPFSHPHIEVAPDGTRTVQGAGPKVKTRPDWWRHQVVHGWPMGDVVKADGTLQLDSAGEYRYRPVGELRDGFTAYERITT
jgi:hypothetical protein